MALKLGATTLTALYLGSTAISAAYLGSTQVYSTGGADPYAVASFSPDLVFDFEQEYYRTGGTETTFDSAITHSRSGNATMVDSDGLLKWAPHNLLPESEFASGWLSYRATNVNGTITESTSSGPQTIYQVGPSTVETRTLKCKLVPVGRDFAVLSIGPAPTEWASATFDLVNGTVTKSDASGAATLDATSISPDGEGYICSITVSGTWAKYFYIGASDTGTSTYFAYGLPQFTGNGLVALNASMSSLYRSDLGGMVNNPDRGDSYVPTTSAAQYLPRRGHHVYNGTSWVNEGLLHESEQGVNLLTYSSEFDNASWGKSTGVTVTANTDVAPDGTTSADTVTSGGNQITQGASCVQNTVYTDSLFFKKTTEAAYTPALYLIFTGGTAAIYAAVINTNTGVHTVVTASGFTAPSAVSVSDAGAYWRLSVSGNSGNNTTVDLRMYPNFIPVVAAAGPGSQVIWGAQLEAGSTPSSYILTFGATATRAADDADSDNLTYDSSAMWFTLSGLQTFADEGVAGQEVLFDWRADANNRITVTIDTDGAETGEITLTVVSGGTTWSVAQDYLSPGINVPFNVAWRVTDTEINVAAGGTSATAVATTSIPDLSSASAAFGGNGVYSLFRQGVGDLGDVGITEASE